MVIGPSLAEEAYRLAGTHGYAAPAEQIEPILQGLRRIAACADRPAGRAGPRGA